MGQRLEDLARPPRAVPLSLRLALRLGGVMGTLGWIFFAAGMGFMLIFVAIADFGQALALSTATLEKADAVALGWAPTNAYVNDEPVVANGAVFRVGAQEHECRSYMVGAGVTQGDRLIVEYDPGDPSVCRIEGMDASLMPWWVLLILAPFVLIGVAFAAWRWRRGGRLIRLMRTGKVTRGTCIDKAATNVRVNDQMQFKYTFRFEDERGRTFEAIARTTDTHALEDEAQEAILYDPYRPEEAMVADTEARLLRMDGHGNWRAPGMRVLPRLIAPAIGVAMVVATAFAF